MCAILKCNALLNQKYNVISWCVVDDLPLNEFAIALPTDLNNATHNEINNNSNNQQRQHKLISQHFLHNHFVQTNPDFGLQSKHVQQIIQILNSNTDSCNNNLETIAEE